MTYDVDYFIAKFEAIPEELWCTEVLTKGAQRCALGWCGAYYPDEDDDDEENDGTTEESLALMSLIPMVGDINDGLINRYQQPTPKQRILAALRDAEEGRR